MVERSRDMDTNRFKKAAQWFYSNVFQDEAIQPRGTPPDEKLPSLLRTARSLENNITMRWQSRESIFLKQGKLLANYEDDYTFEASVTRYFSYLKNVHSTHHKEVFRLWRIYPHPTSDKRAWSRCDSVTLEGKQFSIVF